MSASEVIEKLQEMPADQQESVYAWLRRRRGGIKRLAELADRLLVPPTDMTEEEILKLPRVRPPGH